MKRLLQISSEKIQMLQWCLRRPLETWEFIHIKQQQLTTDIRSSRYRHKKLTTDIRSSHKKTWEAHDRHQELTKHTAETHKKEAAEGLATNCSQILAQSAGASTGLKDRQTDRRFQSLKYPWAKVAHLGPLGALWGTGAPQYGLPRFQASGHAERERERERLQTVSLAQRLSDCQTGRLAHVRQQKQKTEEAQKSEETKIRGSSELPKRKNLSRDLAKDLKNTCLQKTVKVQLTRWNSV